MFISLETVSFNNFQIYARERLGFYLMKKIRNVSDVSYKDWQRIFSREKHLVYPECIPP